MGVSEVSDSAKHWADGLSVVSLGAVFLDWLPQATVVLVFIWTVLRICNEIKDWKIKRQEILINERTLRGD